MSTRPLVITNATRLLDDLLRLAAASGIEVDVASDPPAARGRYPTAPLVLIGADQAEACARSALPPRPRVVIVGHGDVVDQAWEAAEAMGAEHVAALPAAESWLVERLTEPPPTDEGATVIAVIGGRGGAGASLLAAGLAVTAAAAGKRTLLVDADPLGGGLDLVLGWEGEEGLRWDDLADADPYASVGSSLLNGLPRRGDLVALSFAREGTDPVPPSAMAAVLAAARTGRDVVVLDLPRRLDDAAVIGLQSADRTLLVVPAELRAAAAAVGIAGVAAIHCPDVAVVVRGPAPGKLRARDVAEALNLPLAGTLRPDPAMCEAVERGRPPAETGRGPLAELCKHLLDDVLAKTDSAPVPDAAA